MSSPTANCRFFGNLQYSHSARRSQFVGDFGAGRPSSVADCPGRWRWVQSAANPSPCYLANIRVIFENNSEPAAKKAERPCGAGTSDHRANFDIREKQGGSLQSNTVLPAKNRERKDRAAKPPTSSASGLHGWSETTPARYSARFVSQDVGGSRPDDDNPLVDMGCGL